MPIGNITPEYCGNPECQACNLYNLTSFAAAPPATVVTDTDTLALETSCTCEACKLKKGQASTIRRGRVHPYHHSPSQWHMKRTGESDKFPYFMGVELETTRYDTGSYIDNGHAADMRRPKRHWLVKRDGSVSGPEFVSHPATLYWWQAASNDLREMFGYLIHAGYRSHNGREAGMHVNISRDAFTNAEHLLRFLDLLNLNPDWARIMSQRTQNQIDQWARIGARQWNLERVQRMLDRPWDYHTNKYEVINAPSGEKRFEFRLPRGTLRVDRFLKNLEWTAGMISYTRSTALPKAEGFMEWARKYPEVYSNLNSFIGERLSELRSAASNS